MLGGGGALGGRTWKPKEGAEVPASAPTCHTLALGVGTVSGTHPGARVPDAALGCFRLGVCLRRSLNSSRVASGLYFLFLFPSLHMLRILSSNEEEEMG